MLDILIILSLAAVIMAIFGIVNGNKKSKERKKQWEEFKKKYPGSED